MSLAGFETKLPANETPQAQALDCAVIRIDYVLAINLTTKQICKKQDVWKSSCLNAQGEKNSTPTCPTDVANFCE